MKIVEANEHDVLELGYAGERNRTSVRFYYGDLAEEFPGGAVLVQVKRPGELTKYDLTVASDGEYAIWTVNEYDCAVKGFGECQLIYATRTGIAKRKVWKTHIDRSIEGSNASIPPDWEDIEASLLNAAGAMSEELSEARTYIAGAVEAAETAQQGAERAKNAAEAVMEEYEAMTGAGTTLEPGTSVTVSIDRTGTAPVLRIGVPRGEKGDTGDSGVYVGNVQPTDPDVNVWIDPSGSANVTMANGVSF